MANIKSLEILNFKGISKKTEDFDTLPKFIGGENGKGKTSFLEALRYALTGKSPSREDFLRKGEAYGYVCITFDDPEETAIAREFYSEKPTKVSVNGKATTAKNAQQLICSLLNIEEEQLDLTTSSEVFRELFKGELGKYLLSFVDEKFTPEKLFGLVKFSEEETNYLRNKLPANFGLPECETVYKELYTERASLKTLVQRASGKLPETPPQKPIHNLEEIEEKLSKMLAEEQIEKANVAALKVYENAVAAYKRKADEITAIKAEIAAISIDEPEEIALKDLSLKKDIEAKRQEAMKRKATAESVVNTMKNNNLLFEKTLKNLNTNFCPISERLVCTTDKTAAKAEFEALINENNKAIAAQQDIMAKADAELRELAEKEKALNERLALLTKKEVLTSSLEKAEKALGEEPKKPEIVPKCDASQKDILVSQKAKILEYNDYVTVRAEYEKVSRQYELICGLVKKFEAKGIVNEAIIGFYCDIFNEEIAPLASAVDYQILFVPENGLTLSVKPGENKKAVPFENLSNGEQLIVTSFILHMCNMFAGCNIMLIDNLNDLDEENIKVFKSIIEKLSPEYTLLVCAGTNI